jgi:SAM-dependent methyltransferase
VPERPATSGSGVAEPVGSEPYNPNNLLDRHTPQATLEHHYVLMQARERELVHRRLGLSEGRVLSVGAGWHPGRHLFGSPAFELVAADADPAKVAGVLETGRADEAVVGFAGRLGLPPRSFDVVLYRLVLHHIAYKEPLGPCFEEAASLLVPGGALVVIEPGLWHPVGAALAGANHVGFGPRVHGTPDDVPLSPRRLLQEARFAGLDPELHTVTYAWRRLPPKVQRAAGALDRPLGSRTVSAQFGHTLMLIARSGERA